MRTASFADDQFTLRRTQFPPYLFIYKQQENRDYFLFSCLLLKSNTLAWCLSQDAIMKHTSSKYDHFYLFFMWIAALVYRYHALQE